MLVCRCLTTQVIDEEADYQVLNRELRGEADLLRHSLTGIKEKVSCFEDIKTELNECKSRIHDSESARSGL